MFSFFKKKKVVVEEVENVIDDSVNQKELDEIYKASEDANNEEIQVPEDSLADDNLKKQSQEVVNNSEIEDTEEIVLSEINSDVETIESEVSTEEKKGFFSRALSKTFENIKSIVPQKKEKLEFDVIEELLIESDMEY